MDTDNYAHWLKKHLIPNLLLNSVLVVDISHHNTRLNKLPTSNPTKASMKAWLKENEIPCCDTVFKVVIWLKKQA
jgi:hypothetical protein